MWFPIYWCSPLFIYPQECVGGFPSPGCSLIGFSVPGVWLHMITVPGDPLFAQRVVLYLFEKLGLRPPGKCSPDSNPVEFGVAFVSSGGPMERCMGVVS